MPTRAGSGCKVYGCSGVAFNGYCKNHQQEYKDAKYSKFKNRAFDKGNFYQSKEWREKRIEILQQEPTCRACQRRIATVIDHITPRAKGGAELDNENLQPLCFNCHQSKSARDK